MIFNRLLAKSHSVEGTTRRAETLPGHTRDVVQTVLALTETIGEAALRSMGLRDMIDSRELRSALLRAAALHDLGKANSEFQVAVHRPGSPQSLRHEFVSAWLVLKYQELSEWLFAGASPLVRYAAIFAVLGHHLKIRDAADVHSRPSGNASIDVLLSCDDFRACLSEAGITIGLPPAPDLPPTNIDLCDRPLGELRSWLGQDDWWADDATPADKRFVALVKALLISADVGGSVVPRSNTDPAAWTRSAIIQACTHKMLADIVAKDLGGRPPRKFQIEVAGRPSLITFVRAGCGSGKTAAAYMWAQKNAVGRKLFFCYPTTGTTTEGFRSRIENTEAVKDSQLRHGRASADIELLLDDHTADTLERAKRYEALTAWHIPITLCTVDYVLGLIQNYRSALFSFPGIVNSAFVFDEVHQYDCRLFGELLRFITAFPGAPILLLSATLPGPRLEALRQVASAGNVELRMINGPAGLEELKRYELAGIADDPPWKEVNSTLARGGKILWVANTVSRAITFCRATVDRGAIIYHSRYRYIDRLGKHKTVMNAFDDQKPGPVLAVTTQVCEVSLDISADLLITDLAPIPALIQRLGRLNRRASPEKTRPVCRAWFLRPESRLPYPEDELNFKIVEKWVNALSKRPVSQRDLIEAFSLLDSGDPPEPSESAWLDGGPFGYQAPARETEGSIQVIRAEDRARCLKKGKPDLREVVKYAIPMPMGTIVSDIGGWEQIGPAFVAPSDRLEYSTEWGGKWVKSS